MILNTRRKTTISLDQLAELSFILYFSMPLVKRLVKLFSENQSIYLSIALTYLPLILLLCLDLKKRCWREFVCLLFAVCTFFLVTFFIHPEYEFYYTREYYGVWDYVLRPDNGIYAFLFIRLINDPDKIMKYLLISSWLMLVHYGIDFIGYLQRGYWLSVWNGVLRHSTYSLQFGYDVLPFELVSLYFALKDKKLIHWVMAGAGFFMLIAGASRGPMLNIVIFLAAYFFVSLQRSKKKVLILSCLGLLAVGLYFGFESILNAVSELMRKAGLSSRMIKMLMAGTASDDNGRIRIWTRAVQMIEENPWGYGAMGSRPGIFEIIHVGHPHNVFLEILIDFGVIAGAGIILGGLVTLFRILKMENIGEWKGLTLIYIGVSSQLLLSGTYWHRSGIWALLAIGISVFQFRKKEKSEKWLRVEQET